MFWCFVFIVFIMYIGTPKTDNLAFIDTLSSLIYKSLDSKLLIDVYKEPRYTDRLYGYQDIVMRVCCGVFRMYMDVVYWHDGRVWRPLEDFMLETAVNRALVKGGVPKSDIVNYRMKLLHFARGGASMSPLELSPSIIGFQNGVWDFTDIDNPVYHSFAERMPIVDILPYEYDPEAGCPKWNAFLQSILPKGEILKLHKFRLDKLNKKNYRY